MRQLTSRISRLEEQLSESADTAQRLINSLSVVRRSWESLRRSIAGLPSLMGESDLAAQRDVRDIPFIILILTRKEDILRMNVQYCHKHEPGNRAAACIRNVISLQYELSLS
jgi:hypothetical protein